MDLASSILLYLEFWAEVTKNIQGLLSRPLDDLSLSARLVEEVEPRRAQRTLLSISLFYARKAILAMLEKACGSLLSLLEGHN